MVALIFLTKHPGHALGTEFNFRVKGTVHTVGKRLKLCFGPRSDKLHENRKMFFLFGLISIELTFHIEI